VIAKTVYNRRFFIYMSICFSCIPQMPEAEAMEIARTEARSKAISSGAPIAIVKEEDQFYLYNAFWAFENSLPVKEVISHL
jgi:hypothetical protein